MEIKDRIRMVIDSHKLTAGAFADKIGVQRSNVSHVLSGRNKPSFEFIEKVLLAFPKVQANWLVTGKQEVSEAIPVETANMIVNEEEQMVYGNRKFPETENLSAVKTGGKKIVKIVTFYSDFTFDAHFPSEQ